jgi:hypothetical protein
MQPAQVFLLGILIFKRLIARRLYKSLGVEGLIGTLTNAGVRSKISIGGYGVKKAIGCISSPVVILLQYDVKNSN